MVFFPVCPCLWPWLLLNNILEATSKSFLNHAIDRWVEIHKISELVYSRTGPILNSRLLFFFGGISTLYSSSSDHLEFGLFNTYYPQIHCFLGGASGKESSFQCRRHKRCRFSSLEESMATHSSILAWRIPMDRGAWWAILHGVARFRQDWVTKQSRAHTNSVCSKS